MYRISETDDVKVNLTKLTSKHRRDWLHGGGTHLRDDLVFEKKGIHFISRKSITFCVIIVVYDSYMILTYECHPQYNIYIFSTALTHSLAHECMRERTSYCQMKNIKFVNDIDDYMFGFSNKSRYSLK